MKVGKTIIQRSAIGALAVAGALAVSRLFAAPVTQPSSVGKPTTQPMISQSQREASRSGRDSRAGRDRRSSRASSSYTPPLPGDPLGILKSRSIFVKGNQNVSAAPPTASTGSPGGGLAPKAASQLVFNGVTFIDGQGYAFIEDLTADRVATVKVGEGVAGGHVTSIDFDTLKFEAKGKTLSISLGENLEGNSSSGSTASASGGGPTTAPSGSGFIGAGASGGSTAGLSGEDILARMKAKRQAELQGK